MPNDRARIRVLLVIAGLPAGGAERQMALLAENLDRSKFDVGLLIFNSAEKIHYQEVLNLPLWFRALNLSPAKDRLLLIPKLVCGIRHALTDFKPDIIHTTLNVANHAVRFAALMSRCKAPIVTSVRVEYRPSYAPSEKRLERLLWRRSKHIICNSGTTKEQLKTDLGIPANRMTTIPNGINKVFFKDSLERPAVWPKGKIALTVGRFTQQKNHTALVEAIAALEPRGTLTDWHFVFLGDGPLQDTILSLIHQHALQERIRIMPPTQNMPAVYQASDLFILPSLYEGMSNAVLEAAASKCAIIVNKNADNVGLINDDRGWVARNSIQDTLETVISLTDEERAQKANTASAYVEQNFGAKISMNKTVAVYRTVLELS
ncbi:MAG: glycosyltransferase [Alphaproteobacteria bacterium]|nr:glycosyltransferase [Alphaproteobacteria bacterium]